MGGFRDFGGGGGVGKERLTGLGLLCGMTVSRFSPLAAGSDLLLPVDTMRLLAGSGRVVVLWRTLFALPSIVDGLGRPRVWSLMAVVLSG